MRPDHHTAHPQNDIVQQTVDAGAFELGFARVLHEFGVPAGEHHQAVAPLCVAQHTAPQQDLVVVQRVPGGAGYTVGQMESDEVR